ncbi:MULTISPECIES: DUF4148 domain-containing protein [unclassified Caballeronia]|uniref:DUF4148 domain-containing protein n=1 Tax=unclassified Caballeronia TaxID=2646786 RepID=UPI0028565FC1|nr:MULTISPECIES: DUF4148 domain-containing protein [unclassified Caballeronia]MDR5740798.1 DUF4148 domain-containing protein [Caballeronia sp. LZ016]MDR5808681.1 DUF4148 domain-containing protein [Caballeronia sp. LZ019]
MNRAASIRKRMALVCALTAACASPSFADTAPPPVTDATRERIQQDLAQYRCAGFNPMADEITYPADVEAATQRLQTSGCPNSDAAGNSSKRRSGQSK